MAILTFFSSQCGEMADARDLKSLFAKAECGFESRRRQSSYMVFSVNKISGLRYAKHRLAPGVFVARFAG